MSSSTQNVSFISASGGTGKTKISLMLAYYLRQMKQDKKVLFMDLDPTAGASLSVFSEEEYEKHINDKKTLSEALDKYITHRTSIRPEDVIVQARIGNMFVDFIIPGEELVEVVNKLWSGSGVAGTRFKKALESFIPFNKYSYVIIDNAPFFDPRYTALSLHISHKIVIPIRPSLVDLKRTIKLYSWLKDETEASEGSKNLINYIYAVFNHVPSHPKQIEHVFVENFLQGKTLNPSSSISLKQYTYLLIRSQQLKNDGVKFINTYMEVSADVERFPLSGKLPDKAEKFIEQVAYKLNLI